MALARFFDRAHTAIGAHFNIEKEHLERIVAQRAILVRLGDPCLSRGNEQWTANLLINLLARLYPRLILQGNDSACSNAESLAKTINKNIEISSSSENNGITVNIGLKMSGADEIVPSSSGWVASLGLTPLSGPANPFAASFAAALAAGAVFRKSFDEHLPPIDKDGVYDKFSISLLDFTSKSGADHELLKADIGEVAFAGLGAVGNAAIHTLGCLDEINGQAWLVDHELIELSNLQRYALSRDEDDLISLPKTVIAERALLGNGLKLHQRQMRLHEFADEFQGSFMIPTICVSVDNYHDRRVAQTLLPRLVVNGYTGKTDIGASWHRIGDHNRQCLACLYRGEKTKKSSLERMSESLGLTMQEVADLIPRQKTLTINHTSKIENHCGISLGTLSSWIGKHINQVYSDITCGQMSMQTFKSSEEIVPLAHQSVMAGILMGSELIKRTSTDLELRSQPFEQVTWGNILASTPSNWGQTSPATSGCICRDPDYVDAYKDKWSNSATPPTTTSS